MSTTQQTFPASAGNISDAEFAKLAQIGDTLKTSGRTLRIKEKIWEATAFDNITVSLVYEDKPTPDAPSV